MYTTQKKKKKKTNKENFSKFHSFNSSQSDTSIRLIVTFGPRVNVVKNIVTGSNRSGRRRELISRTGAQRVFLH